MIFAQETAAQSEMKRLDSAFAKCLHSPFLPVLQSIFGKSLALQGKVEQAPCSFRVARLNAVSVKILKSVILIRAKK